VLARYWPPPDGQAGRHAVTCEGIIVNRFVGLTSKLYLVGDMSPSGCTVASGVVGVVVIIVVGVCDRS